jgi:hypothetical protein
MWRKIFFFIVEFRRELEELNKKADLDARWVHGAWGSTPRSNVGEALMYSLALCCFSILVRLQPFFNVLVRPQPFLPWLITLFILVLESGVFFSQGTRRLCWVSLLFCYYCRKEFLLDWHGQFPSIWAQFSLQKILQNFSHSPSHLIFRRMHEALNINKK